MRKSTISKTIFFVVAIAFLVVWNVGCSHVVANNGLDFISPTLNNVQGDANLDTNADEVIDPPLGNATKPGIGAMFSMIALLLPTEITLIFIAEVIFGTSMGLDPKKKSFARFGIMLGSAGAVSVVSGIVNYLLVYPAIHDIPIHRHTYLKPGTGIEVDDVMVPPVNLPQYGSAETFNSFAVNILFLILAAIILLGAHYLALRYIQRTKITASIVSLILPLVIYPIIWSTLIKQVTEKAFFEKTGDIWTFSALLAGGFILFSLLLMLWKLTLLGTSPKEEIDPTASQIEKTSQN